MVAEKEESNAMVEAGETEGWLPTEWSAFHIIINAGNRKVCSGFHLIAGLLMIWTSFTINLCLVPDV
ncbi:hypothetical protein IEQ34_006270 [Dendrobium chrysotoxum]|uniref:Uncharacterized protein n=1 Tax=Dendrobium chrysotoxum TaxID=161865 RepID=A0AAV7HBB4_DENCH|nr:hypothetical protein IEQ34_006270 [Dendrobium chrysotoxum]